MLRRKALESLKPDVIIEINGKKVKVTSVTSLKTLVEEYEFDEPATFDPGSGTEETFISSLEVNDKIFRISEQGQNGLAVDNSKRSCKLSIMILYKFCTTHMTTFLYKIIFLNILLGKQNTFQKTRERCRSRNERVYRLRICHDILFRRCHWNKNI